MNNIKILNIEVAKSPYQLGRGLMFRENLPSDSGMLFSFPKNDVLSFWGMNTFLPLDIAFINKSNTIDSIGRIKPHDLTSVKSKNSCCHAIEANEGWFHKNNICEGDFIEVFNDNLGNSPKVFFIKKQDSIKLAQVEDSALEDDLDLMEPTDDELEIISRDNFFDDSDITDSEYLADNEDSDRIDDESDVTLDEVDDITRDIQDGAREYLDQEGEDEDVSIDVPEFGSIFQAINWGKANSQTMVIKYKTLKGNVIVRNVEPHDLFFARTTRRQIMVTFDKKVGAPRSFIVMNILEYSFDGTSFVPKFMVI
tara:strand:+ start:968 stop:1897 length:930 start_codon:yes stop_codon:yes gene_type:complete